jgi:translation elongation factor EF-Tu-like GTPase
MFKLTVEDVFAIRNRGVVVTGRADLNRGDVLTSSSSSSYGEAPPI